MNYERFKKPFRLLYLKLVRTNDAPQKVALGFGLGVFAGILPGTGPIAAIFLASIAKVNRAAALLGSLVTNTWLSFVTFLIAVKIGSWATGGNWQDIKEKWSELFRHFSLGALFKASVLKIMLPVMLGYFVVAVCCGLISYLAIMLIMTLRKKAR